MKTAILFVLLVSIAMAGDRTIITGDNSVLIWSSADVTTGTITSTGYPLTREEYLAGEIFIQGLASTDSVTLTPIYSLHGSTTNLAGYATPDGAGNTVVITSGTDALAQVREFAVVNGARLVYFTATTSDTNSATISMRVGGQ